MPLFVELSIIVVIAAAFSVLMRVLKQPLVVGYILAGILVGPYFLNVLQSTEALEVFAKIGITILLFIVGLHLSPTVIKEVGKISVIAGVGQVVFTSLVGFAIAKGLNFSNIASIYIAIALTFSSTIIILKLLSDRGDLNKLYGKISVGFLLVQDIIATAILVMVSALSAEGSGGIAITLALLFIKFCIVSAALYAIVRYILPRFASFFGASQELLFLSTLAWGLSISAIFYLIGFSIEIGALLAGVLMSMTPFAYEMSSRLKPMRDFFLVLFFVFLGTQMILESLAFLFFPALIFSLFVLIGNPIIVFIIMTLLGYRKRPSFFAGLTVAQISEFSLILAGLGLTLGHINEEIVSLITLVGLITIAGSTYFILYAHKIYPRIEKFLQFLDWRSTKNVEKRIPSDTSDIYIFGYDRMGDEMVRAAKKLEKSFLVIDFNPAMIRRLEAEGIPNLYGDAQDAEFLAELGIHQASLVVSTIPDQETNTLLIRYVKNVNDKALVVAIAHTLKEAKKLYEEGASYVLMPHFIGAKYGRQIIAKHGLNGEEFASLREKHLREIERKIF
ncbi:MAG: cation:proton antiporter [bacterium]|nr:cation:proton antiporter [bacterium]